ncbi:MAG: hypothetical protein JO332_04990, partial [Planctomycetaceae bacterium]|nr:hypothetical protein [Planctomycetaceae bacterium]
MIAGIELAGAGKPAPAGTVLHGLRMPLPSTWTRKDDSTGAVLLIPPQLEGVRQYLLTVLPPSKAAGSRWESHKALLKGVLAQVRWTEEPVTVHYADAPGPFIRTSIAGKVEGGGLQSIELYTALHDGVVETVVGINGIDRNVVDPVLKGTTFKDPPQSTERPKIVEAYRRLDQKLYPNLEGGALRAGSLQYERIMLRADGLADFSTSYPEGYAASPLVLKVDPGLAEGDYGTWKAVGDRVQIVRRAGLPPEVYVRDGDALSRDGKVWEPMPRVDGLKLNGRWGARSGPDRRASWIEFSADGKFSTEGALADAAVGEVERPKPPEKGSGTYEIRDWTIFFTFADGRVWSTDFSILGRDPGQVTSILFRTFALPREK